MGRETIETLAVQIALDDSSFQAGVKNLDRQIGVIDSAFKSSTAGVKNWGISLDGLKSNAQALGDKIGVQKQIVSSYTEQINKAKSALEQNSQKTLDNKSKLDSARAAYEQSAASVGKNAEQTKQLKKELDAAQKAFDSSEKVVLNNNKAVQDYTVKLNGAEAKLKDYESQLSSTNQKIADQTSKVKAAADGLEKYGEKLNKAGEKTSETGEKLTKGITVPILAVGTAATTAGMNFEAQMSRVQAIAGASGDELKKLSDQALQLGADTSFSAMGAAQGMENLASAGFTTSEIMAAMPGMLDLAASSGEDLANSADIAASTLRGFGLAAGDAGHVADVLAKNAAATNAAVADTGAAMKYIAPVAQSAGWSLESVTAAIGEMANAGIKGEQAGTTLRGALTNLMNPSKQQAAAMKEIGFSAYDAHGKMKPLSQIIGELDKKTKGLTDKQKDQKIATIMGTESLSGMQVLLKDGSKGLDTMTAALKSSDGAAKDMAKTMMNNAKGSVEQMKGSLETAGITISKSVAPTITTLADKVTDLANDFSKLPPKTQENIVKAAAFAAAIGPVTVGLGKVTSGIGSVFSATGKTIQGVRDFSLGLKGVGVDSVEAASSALKFGSAVASIGGGPVLLAIGAVAVSIGLIANACINSKSETQKLIETIDAQRDSWNELKESADKAAGADLALVDRNQDLWKELENVTDQNGKVKSAYVDRAKFILGELNTALGTEYTINGNTITQYQDMQKEIDKLIDKKRAEILLDTHKQEYQTALQKIQETESSQAKARIELTKQEQKTAEAKAKMDKFIADGSLSLADYYRGQYNEQLKQLNDKRAAYDKTKSQLLDYYATVGNWEKAAAANTKGNYNEVKATLNSVKLSYSVATGATREQLQQQVMDTQVKLREIKNAFANHAEGVTNEMVTKAAEAARTASDEFLKVGNEAGKGITIGLDSQSNLIYTSGQRAGYRVADGARSIDYAKYGKTAGASFGNGFSAVAFESYNEVFRSFAGGGKASVPQVTPPILKWHASGAYFDRPTIAGISGNVVHGFGEAGPEVGLPLTESVYSEMGKGILRNLRLPEFSSMQQKSVTNITNDSAPYVLQIPVTVQVDGKPAQRKNIILTSSDIAKAQQGKIYTVGQEGS